MNEQERSELERLSQRQSYLQDQVALLGGQIKAFEARLISTRQTNVPPAMEIQPLEIKPAEMPPFASPPAPPKSSPHVESAERLRNAMAKPPPLPPMIPPSIPPSLQTQEQVRQPSTARMESFPASGAQGSVPSPAFEFTHSTPPPIAAASAAPRESSFEMRLGTYWLVRVGVVMLLSALGFFGYYAYEHYIPRLGAAGKVVLLYLASATLLGVGGWFQRGKVKESLRNYGQVVFAGGLAAVYFTTYAAHHIANLRVIQSALLDGALLFGWAGFMVWLADRRKSEVLALFAIGLAYYTSVITNIGLFTLYSNLVLTLAAVFFLLRNRWANLSFVTLVATYASCVFWRFIHNGKIVWRHEDLIQDFWTGNLFVLGYWIVFTAAVFLTKHEKFSDANRASFLWLNNSAFFGLITVVLLQVHRDWFWAFSLGYGGILLGLTLMATRLLGDQKLAQNSYLIQGLLLVTVGLIAKFTGLQLALLLGAQSVALIVLSELRRNRILRLSAAIVALLAVAWGISGIKRFDPTGLVLGTALGAMMTFNAWWTRRYDREPDRSLLRLRTAYYVGLALLIWLVTTTQNTSRSDLAVVLAFEALALTASLYVLRIREMTLLGQSYLILAQLLLLSQIISPATSSPWWSSAAVITITLGLSHWWQRQRVLQCEPQISQFIQGLYALALIGLMYNWLHPHFSAPAWLAFTSLLAVAATAYGVLTRAWMLAACGQLFLVASSQQFVLQLLTQKPGWHFSLAPIGALALLSFAVVRWFARHPDASQRISEPLLQFARLYRWLALAMSIWWVHAYIPAREQSWTFTLLGLMVFLWSGWRQSREALIFSAAFSVTGLTLFWIQLDGAPTVYWPNLLAILTLLSQQQIASRASVKYHLEPPVQGCIIGIGGASLWLFFSRWVLLESGGFYLTVVWSALALGLFVVGLALRERMYRWLGLTVLACSLGRVVFFDVWKLETIYRVVSFMALGVVLLVLGFIYNKYLERLKQWL